MNGAARIAVVGASGRVGQALVRHLQQHTPHRLTLASRRPPSDPPTDAPRIEWRAVDLYDPRQLAALCRDQDLVINCAGPSMAVGDRVAQAAWAAGPAYLDPGGYDPLWHQLQRRAAEWRAAGRACVINAGLLPGLSGLLPRALVEHGLRAGRQTVHCSRLDCICVGRDAWTEASAADIIDSLGDFGAEAPPSWLQHGEPQAVPWRQASWRVELDPPAGRQTVWLTRTLELQRLGARLHLPAVYGWGANNGTMSALVLAAAKLLRLYRRPAGQRLATQALVAASRRDLRHAEPMFLLDCRARYRNGSTLRARWSTGDTYKATGLLLGLAAQRICAGQVPAGVSMFEEAFGPQALLAELAQHGAGARFDEALSDGMGPLSLPATPSRRTSA